MLRRPDMWPQTSDHCRASCLLCCRQYWKKYTPLQIAGMLDELLSSQLDYALTTMTLLRSINAGYVKCCWTMGTAVRRGRRIPEQIITVALSRNRKDTSPTKKPNLTRVEYSRSIPNGVH